MATLGEQLARIVVALLAGLLIGMDRERAEERKRAESFAGVRTFPLIALTGCIGVLLMPVAGPWLLLAAFAAVLAITIIAYIRATGQGRIGATTEVAAVATFLLGAAAGAGEMLIAGAVAVIVAVLLVAKPPLERLSRALSPQELVAVLELAVISVIVLPLVPSQGYGPWNLLNPREIWLVVVLVAGLSFTGFVAVRVLGEQRGLAVTGAVGGLVSSTAVTLAMAERSREGESGRGAAAAAVVLASSVMGARVLFFAGAINRTILPVLAPPVIAMIVTGAIAAWLLSSGDGKQTAAAGSRIQNPFSLKAAVSFALIYAVILVVARAAFERFGTGGIFAAAALSSIADVDAVTIAVTRLGPGDAGWVISAAAIVLAVIVNTLVKLAIAASRGAGEFRGKVARALGAMSAAAAAVQVGMLVLG
jgi:uncharacterized membrane protein (DUF4010 family)